MRVQRSLLLEPVATTDRSLRAGAGTLASIVIGTFGHHSRNLGAPRGLQDGTYVQGYPRTGTPAGHAGRGAAMASCSQE